METQRPHNLNIHVYFDVESVFCRKGVMFVSRVNFLETRDLAKTWRNPYFLINPFLKGPTVRQCDKKGSNFTQGLDIS